MECRVPDHLPGRAERQFGVSEHSFVLSELCALSTLYLEAAAHATDLSDLAVIRRFQESQEHMGLGI